MISIIIPIYNAEKQLNRMLESVQKQSYRNYEVLMIDDGSQDQSANICQSFCHKDIRFKYYYQENQGVSIARNNGLKKAAGDYIAFLDADDRIDVNYFEELMNACQYSDIAVCDVVIEVNNEEVKRFTYEKSLLKQKEAVELLLKRKGINSGPYAKLFKKQVVESVEFPLLKTYEDILFVLAAFSKANAIGYTPNTQYHYIENIQGAMSSMGKEPSTDIIVASETIIQYIEKQSEKLDSECIYITVSHLFQYVLAMVRKECKWNEKFLKEAILFYKNYEKTILKCKAIPFKEKIVFFCFMFGGVYTDRKWFNINRTR